MKNQSIVFFCIVLIFGADRLRGSELTIDFKELDVNRVSPSGFVKVILEANIASRGHSETYTKRDKSDPKSAPSWRYYTENPERDLLVLKYVNRTKEGKLASCEFLIQSVNPCKFSVLSAKFMVIDGVRKNELETTLNAGTHKIIITGEEMNK